MKVFRLFGDRPADVAPSALGGGGGWLGPLVLCFASFVATLSGNRASRVRVLDRGMGQQRSKIETDSFYDAFLDLFDEMIHKSHTFDFATL